MGDKEAHCYRQTGRQKARAVSIVFKSSISTYEIIESKCEHRKAKLWKNCRKQYISLVC